MKSAEDAVGRVGFTIGALIGAAISLLAILLQPSPTPAAAQGPAVCDTFDTPGQHVFEVPNGVTTITAEVFGAQGGDVLGTSSQFGTPGLGGGVTGVQVPVTPGELLEIRVGGRGFDSNGGSQPAPPGGFNGGGDGAVGAAHTSTSGGGASQINRGNDILVIAGGGGGAAHGGNGGNGGLTGTDGTKHAGSAGAATGGESGGDGGAGGAGAHPSTGALSPAQDGGDGTAAAGGNAGEGGNGGGDPTTLPVDGGGGGGGGFVGGGGGGGGPGNGGTGGGGGSSFDATGTGTFGTGARSGDGLVTLSYDCSQIPEPPEACVTFDAAGTYDFTIPQGLTEIEATVFGAEGGSVPQAGLIAPSPGGLGGGAQGLPIAVTPGETLTIEVGGAGGDPTGGTAGTAGANGGGAGGTGTSFGGGGGGGASEILRGSTLLVIGAGGGGGGRGTAGGGDGGRVGENGGAGPGTGTVSSGFAGGLGGEGGGTGAAGGGDGTPGQGGAGGSAAVIAGGGGGGGGAVGGGGGGAPQGAGGGGSSDHSLGNVPVTWAQGVEEGDGRVELAFDCADVGIAKDATLLENGNIEFELTLENFGPNDATGVTVTDELPDVTYISDDCGGVNGATEWSWDLGDLASGTTATCTITVSPDRTGQIDNTACVESQQVDANATNECDDGTVVVPPEADVSTTKVAQGGSFSAGDDVTYLITVDNAGPDAAADVELTDDLPAGLTFVSATPNQGTCNNADPIDCDLGTIAADGQATVTVAATIDAGQQGNSIENTACSDTSTTDADANNDCDDESIDVDPEADIETAKVAQGGPFSAGDNVTYEITVDNNGPNDAEDVELSDDLPAGLTFVSATPSQGTCNSADPIDCDLGTIAANGQATISVLATIGAGQSDNQIENTACADTSTTDTDVDNDCDDESIDVEPEADVEVAKVAQGGPFAAGDDVSYIVTVTNNGPNAATNVEVTDDLAGSLTFVSATPEQGTCNNADPLDCELGTIANGDSVEIELVARIAAGQQGNEIDNTACASTTTTDLDDANNCATEQVRVESPPKSKPRLKVKKRASDDSVRPGEVLTYKITVRNKGKAPARNVRVCDLLPSGQRALRAPGAEKRNDKRVCWKIGRLAPGAKQTLRVTTQVEPGAKPGKQRNKVIADGHRVKAARDGETVSVSPAGDDCPRFARC